jgi:predicted nuclease of predicted toxin-antitoxin system
MSRLFVSVYLDEDVDVLLAELVSAKGYVALTTRDAGNRSRPDDEQLMFATSRGMAIVTHNFSDYAALSKEYANTGKRHCGIILTSRRDVFSLARRLLVILDDTTADEMDNSLIHI